MACRDSGERSAWLFAAEVPIAGLLETEQSNISSRRKIHKNTSSTLDILTEPCTTSDSWNYLAASSVENRAYQKVRLSALLVFCLRSIVLACIKKTPRTYEIVTVHLCLYFNLLSSPGLLK